MRRKGVKLNLQKEMNMEITQDVYDWLKGGRVDDDIAPVGLLIAGDLRQIS